MFGGPKMLDKASGVIDCGPPGAALGHRYPEPRHGTDYMGISQNARKFTRHTSSTAKLRRVFRLAADYDNLSVPHIRLC